MASAKDIFEPHMFAANTFACWTWRGAAGGPFCFSAVAVSVGGSEASEVFSGGAERSFIFSAGAEKVQVSCP